MQPLINYLKKPNLFLDSIVSHFGSWLPDDVFVKLRYRFQVGKKIDLKAPQSFQEKIQWLKLYDHNPNYSRMVDKILVKDYVSSLIGEEYVVPLLGVWDTPKDIDWDILPDQFVLKTNHSGGSTGVVICRDKMGFDRQKAITRLTTSLKSDVYKNLREWPYKGISKKVFAEALLESPVSGGELPDFKWYCFNGDPRYCQVIQNRSNRETIDFYDTAWVRQEFIGLNPSATHAACPAEKPSNLDTQIRIARVLSKNIPFVRIDLYSVGERVYFGEITFYPFSGMGEFSPRQYNEILGKMIVLPYGKS